MLEQYFGTKSTNNEQFIIDSILEHTMIDEEKLYLLQIMIKNLCSKNYEEIEDIHNKIIAIRNDSIHIFEYIEEQITQAHLDFQKRYDFLRIFQRKQVISSEVLRCSENIVMFVRLNANFPSVFCNNIESLIHNCIQAHEFFKKALMMYDKNKNDVFDSIHKVVNIKNSIQKIYFESVENIYQLANQGQLKLGDMRSIENIFSNLESMSTSIESASTSLEWLLIS